MSSKQYTTEFVIKGDSSSGVKATRDLEQANAELTQEMQRAQRQSEEMASSYESVGVHAQRLATFTAASAAAMATMAISQTRNIAEQDALSRSIGVSLQTLQQWEFAAQSVNLGAGKMGDIFKDVSEKIGDFVATGGGEAADLFERLTLNIDELMGMSPDQQLLAIGKALDDVATQGEKIFFMESLANDASLLIPLLDDNAEALRQQILLAEQLGITVSQSDIESLKEANQALNNLNAIASGFANTVAVDLAPSLVSLSESAVTVVSAYGGIEEVVGSVANGAVLLSTVLGVRLVNALGASALASIKKVQADRAVAIQAGITAEREAGAALATARRAEAERVAALNSAANAAQRAQAAQVQAASQLRSIQLTQQQMAAERVLETQRLQAQISATGRQQSLTRLAEIRRTEMALTTQSAAAQRALNAAEVQSAASARTLSAAKVDLARATTATTAAATANTAAVAANTAAQRTLTAVSRGAAGAMALVGGPLGVATLAATAFFLFRDSSDDVSSSLTDMNAPLETVIADFKELSVESQRAAMIKWGDRYQEEVEKTRSALSKIREEILSIGFDGTSGAEARAFFDEVNAGFEAVESGAKSLDELLNGLQDQLGVPDSALRQIRLWAAEYSEGSITVEELGGLLQTLETAFNDVAQGAENSGQAVNGGAPSATTLDAWKKYNDRLRESIAATRDGGSAMGAASRALDGMGDDVNNIMRGYSVFLSVQDEALKDQRKAQQEAAAESRRAAEEAERTAQRQAQAAQQSAEAQAKALAGVQQEMDPLLADYAEYVERLAVLDRALAEGTISEEAYGEAVRWNAEQYQRAATGAEDYEKQSKSLISTYDSHNQKAQQLREALAQINQMYRAGEIDGDQYARMVGGVRDEMQQLALDADPAAQEMARAWEEASNRIDETFADAFAGAFDSFDDFTDQLLDGFKRLLAELAYQATLKPIVVQFTQQMGGALGIPGVGGQGGGGFNLGSIGSLKSGWDTVSGLWGAGSAASTAAAGYGAAGWAGSATGAYSGWAGSAAAGAAQAGGGLMGAASAAMPWVGKTAPKFELATVDSNTRGHGVFEDYGSGVVSRGAFGAVGFTDEGTARLEETFGGFENATAFLDSITAMDNALAAVAGSEQELDAMTEAVRAVRLNASDAAGIANQLATRTLAVVDVIDGDFSASLRGLGLNAEQITGRVVQAANAMQLLDSNSARLNLQFDASAAGAMRAADGMAQLMGGVGNLNASLGSFYDAFYTEEEKLRHLAEDLSSTFASMGRELPTTREGVRDVVESLELMGAAGQEQLATILQLNGPLAQYIAAMEEQRAAAVESGEAIDDNAESMRAMADIARERAGLERELLSLQGNTAELRRRELARLDPSNQALQSNIWALGDVQGAYQQVEKAVNAERQILENAYRATTASINANISTVQQAMQESAAVADTLSNSLDTLLNARRRESMASRRAAQDYLQSTLASGGLGDSAQLERALGVVSEPSEGLFSSFTDYQRDFYQTANVIASLEERAEAQVSVEEQSLKALENQLQAAERQYAREMESLDSMLVQQQLQIENELGQMAWLESINGSVLGVGEAIGGLQSAISSAISSAAASAASAAKAASEASRASAASSSGSGYRVVDNGDSATYFTPGGGSHTVQGSGAADLLRRTYANQLDGSHADGLWSVPFDGYRAELHRSETVLPAPAAQAFRDFAGSGGGGGEMLKAFQQLIKHVENLEKEVSELKSINKGTASHTSKIASTVDRMRRETME